MQKIFSGHVVGFGIREKKVSVSEVQRQKGQAANIFISDNYFQEKLADFLPWPWTVAKHRLWCAFNVFPPEGNSYHLFHRLTVTSLSSRTSAFRRGILDNIRELR
jgi:hypothetical protein